MNKLLEKKNFKLENEMVDFMLSPLCNLFKTKNCIREFQTGNGIPDIVFVKGISLNNEILNYAEFCYINKILRKKNVSKKDISNNKLKKFLISKEYIKENGDKYIILKNKVEPSAKNIVAIEAKLADWKNGFYQALRYQYFANESYLAITAKYVKNIDIDLFKESGIGLISVDKDSIKIILKAQKRKPLNYISHLYSAQQLALQLKHGNTT